MISHSKSIFKLLLRGQTRLIKVSLLSLPLVLTLVFFGFFVTQNLVQAFEKQMHKSYFGLFGELQIASESEFLKAIASSPELAHLSMSYRATHQSVYLFELADRNVLKGVNLIAYQAHYLDKKFNAHNEDTNQAFNSDHSTKGVSPGELIEEGHMPLIISSVVANQLAVNQEPIESIYHPKTKISVAFNQQRVEDFGFLGAKPIIVMSMQALSKLNAQEIKVNQLEFSQLGEGDLERIEKVANQLMLKGLAQDYQIINPKTLSHEAKQVFETIKLFKNLFFFVLLVICTLIYVFALKLLLNTKKTSIGILECLGVSRYQIILNLLLLLLISFCMTYWAGLLLAQYLSPFIMAFVELGP